MTKITGKIDFAEKILSGVGLQVVRFCAEWSGPCQIMGPIYEDMSVMFKSTASFYRVDVDEAPALKNELGISELPTILFYENGSVVDFVFGLISRDLLIMKLKKLIMI